MHRNLRSAGALVTLLTIGVLVGCSGGYTNASPTLDTGPDAPGVQDEAGKLGQGLFAPEAGLDPSPDGGATMDGGNVSEGSLVETGGGSADASSGTEAAVPESGSSSGEAGSGTDSGAENDSSTTAGVCPMTPQYATEAVQAIAGGSPIVCNSQTSLCQAGDCCYISSPLSVCVTQ